jgi:hypothetical protein
MPLNRLLCGLALAGLLLMGLALRLTGIAAPSLHPDEPTIGRWLETHAEQGELRDRLYPGGFFTLAAPFRSAGLAWNHLLAERAYAAGAADRPIAPWNDIRFARRLNVGLGLLTGLCLFFLTLQITGSRLSALAVAAFCLLNPVHIEHCHYAETDIALLFGLSLTLLLWARAIYSGRALFILVGGFAAGFTAGTKYPLILLLVPLLIIPFVSRSSGRGTRSLRRTWVWLALSLFLFALALAWTNPALREPARFMQGLAKQSEGLRAEMTLALGAAGQSPSMRFLWRLHMLRKHALDLGLLPLALAAAGLLALPWIPRLRKAWPLLLLTPLLLLALNLLVSPFIRKQEFMGYLPFLSILAALPLALPRSASRLGRFFVRGPVILVTLIALMQIHLDARRVTNLFGWKDPRLMARDWNALHAPEDKSIAVEHNASVAAERSFADHIPLRHVADLREGLTLLDRFPADYLIRNEFTSGRGLVDPFTGNYRPRHQPLWDRFQARARLLKTWSPFPFPRANASHAGHAVSLYALDLPPASLDLQLPLADPIFVSEAGRETFFSTGNTLGGRESVRVTGVPREIAAGGPGPAPDRLWVTLTTEKQDADIRLRAWGRTTRVHLPPGSAQTVTLDKPWWWLVPEPYARVRVWALASPGLASPPCWLGPGREEALAPEETRRALDTLARALLSKNNGLAVNGLPEFVYNDFARIRDLGVKAAPAVLAADKIRRRDAGVLQAIKREQLRRLGRDPEKTCLSVSPYRTPFRLSRGSYRLTLDVRPLPSTVAEEPTGPDADRFELTDASGKTLLEGRWPELDKNRDTTLSLALPVEREESPEIFLITPFPRTLSIRRAELTWTLRDRLLALQQTLSASAK